MEKVGAYTPRVNADGGWRAGDPASGQQATPMLAAYFNMLQAELLNILVEAGIAPSLADNGQLTKAIKAIVSAGSGFQIGSPVEDAATSWDTLLTPGLHQKLIKGSNPKGPGGDRYFYCRTYKRGAAGAFTQFAEPYATPDQSGQWFWRGFNSGTWTEWNKVMASNDFATLVEATSGVLPDRLMSPLTTAQAIASKIATQQQAEAGADDTRLITPKKMVSGCIYSAGETGYIILPSWMAGITLQWGKIAATVADTQYPITFPIAFRNAAFNVQATFGYNDARIDDGGTAQTRLITKSGFTANRQDIGGISSLPNAYIHYFAVGQ